MALPTSSTLDQLRSVTDDLTFIFLFFPTLPKTSILSKEKPGALPSPSSLASYSSSTKEFGGSANSAIATAPAPMLTVPAATRSGTYCSSRSPAATFPTLDWMDAAMDPAVIPALVKPMVVSAKAPNGNYNAHDRRCLKQDITPLV